MRGNVLAQTGCKNFTSHLYLHYSRFGINVNRKSEESCVHVTFASVRRFARFWLSEDAATRRTSPCVRSSQLTCERNANVRNAARRKDRCDYTHNIYFFFHIYLPSSHAFANSHDYLAAQMLCASCAGACALVREGTIGRPKRKRGAMPSCQRSVRPPTILPSVLRTSQRPGLQLFSETSGLNQFGPRITIVRTLIASRHDCRLASGTARNAPTLRHVREEGLGRSSPRPREVAP